jgi:hypothetical protein
VDARDKRGHDEEGFSLFVSVHDHVARLRELLHLDGGHIGNRDAVVIAESDHGVAMRIAGDQRFELLHALRIGEVVELNRVVRRIEVYDGVGADARLEHEIVVARPADANRSDLVVPGSGRWIGNQRAGSRLREIEVAVADSADVR